MAISFGIITYIPGPAQISSFNMRHPCLSMYRRARGYSQKNWVGECGLLPKNPYPINIMTKICDISYPIFDLTENSKPYL